VINPASTKITSLYIARFLLQATGVLLIVYGIFCGFLAYGLGRRLLLESLLMLVGGVGFLLPRLWTKFFSSFLIAGTGVWLFIVDACRWSDWSFDCLYFVPLLVTLWLCIGYSDVQLRRRPNAD
jgi:hypothetical protein